MPADVAQHLDPVQFRQPLGIVRHHGVVLACAEAQEAGKHLLDAVLVALDVLDRKDLARLVLAGGIADAGGAAAHQRDRLVAGLLQPIKAHDLHHGADMQRRRGAVEADIGDELALLRQRIQRLGVRNLMNEAAVLQHIEKIRFKCSHLSGALIILVLRYLQQFMEPCGIGCRRRARCGIIRCACLAQAGRQGQKPAPRRRRYLP